MRDFTDPDAGTRKVVLNELRSEFLGYCKKQAEIARKKAGNICRSMRASKKAPGADRIYTAGEKAFEAKAKREASGIPVEENTLKELDAIADALHVARLER